MCIRDRYTVVSSKSSAADNCVLGTRYSFPLIPHTSITVPAAKTAQAVQNKNTARVTVTTQVRTDAQTIANNRCV